MNKVKLLLCYPPEKKYQGYGQGTNWFPLGIATLGAYINECLPNVDICLFDFFSYKMDDSYELLIQHLEDDFINLIGFTCMTEQRFSCFEFAGVLKKTQKELNKNIKIVLGGAHASCMHEQIFKNYDFIDFIIKGEGERGLKFLIESLIKGENINKLIECERIENLSMIPYAVEGIKLFKTDVKLEDAPIVLSRGCTDLCTFCNSSKYWKGYRYRYYQDVYAEMLLFFHTYGLKSFKFHDDSCTANIDNVKNLMKLIINNNYGWEFEITARADQLDDELIDLLALANKSISSSSS